MELFQETILFILSIISENSNVQSIKKFTTMIDISSLVTKMYEIYKYMIKNRMTYLKKEDNCTHKKCENLFQCS
jgi:flagellar basal body rod protein FlgG